MTTYSNCPCHLDTPSSTVKCPKGSLRHAQMKEEYLIDRYSNLLAIYEAQYLAIGQALMASESLDPKTMFTRLNGNFEDGNARE
ncbi:hypothetical protein B7494_g3907 [Chlorociboria aeruginascens]|nr:hypothetical protein B7494_g3907 [Chlorociboria aeruginascens]